MSQNNENVGKIAELLKIYTAFTIPDPQRLTNKFKDNGEAKNRHGIEKFIK